MAFSWILGRRRNYLQDRVEEGAWPPNQEAAGHDERSQSGPINLADVKLSIEDGLVMTFGPLGDPIPPQLLKEACARQPRAVIRLPNGAAVDHERLITVIEAQQAGRLAERPTEQLIESLLDAGGSFEPVSTASLVREDAEGKSVVAGRLILDLPGSETITVHDAHPGSAENGIPARLTVDGQPVSIADILSRSGQLAPGESVHSISNPVVSVEDDDLSLVLDDQTEMRLETTSEVWDGEAKVALFLEDGRSISVDDLTTLLRGRSSCKSREAPAPATTYPLFGNDDPDLRLDHATIVTISDVPEGWSITTGERSKQGIWILDPSTVEDAVVRVSGRIPGPQSLMVKVISVARDDGALDHHTRTVVIPPESSGDAGHAPDAPVQEGGQRSETPVRLIIDEAALGQVAGADAVLLKGMPEASALSEGVFDPSVGGWVLKPEQLHQMAIGNPGDWSGAIDISLRPFRFDDNGQPRSAVISAKASIA